MTPCILTIPVSPLCHRRHLYWGYFEQTAKIHKCLPRHAISCPDCHFGYFQIYFPGVRNSISPHLLHDNWVIIPTHYTDKPIGGHPGPLPRFGSLIVHGLSTYKWTIGYTQSTSVTLSSIKGNPLVHNTTSFVFCYTNFQWHLSPSNGCKILSQFCSDPFTQFCDPNP